MGYGTIPNEILFDDQLTPLEKLVFILVSSLAQKRGYCSAKNDYIGERLKRDGKPLSESHVSTAVGALAKKKYIYATPNSYNTPRKIYVLFGKNPNAPLENSKPFNKANKPSEKSKSKSVGKPTPPTLEIIHLFCQTENIALEIGTKFHGHYTASDWRGGKGASIVSVWQERLKTWNKDERPAGNSDSARHSASKMIRHDYPNGINGIVNTDLDEAMRQMGVEAI